MQQLEIEKKRIEDAIQILKFKKITGYEADVLFSQSIVCGEDEICNPSDMMRLLSSDNIFISCIKEYEAKNSEKLAIALKYLNEQIKKMKCIIAGESDTKEEKINLIIDEIFKYCYDYIFPEKK